MKNTQKQVKKTNPFLDTLKFLGISLFSNKACVEGRKRPWWLAILAFFLSIVLAVVPLTYQAMNQKGSAFLYGVTYDTDLGLEAFTNELLDKDINIVITKWLDGKNRLGFENTSDSDKWNLLTASTEGHYEFRKYLSSSETENEIDNEFVVRLKVFLAFGHDSDGNSNAYLLLHNELTGIGSTLTPPKEGEEDNGYVAPISYAIFGDEEMYFVIYKPGTEKATEYAAYTSGDYANLLPNENTSINLKDLMKKDLYNPSETNETSILDSAWITFLNNGYINARNLLVLVNVSLMGAIFLVVNIIFGLSVYLMTRGKNNPNRSITFGEAYKIGAFAATAPAILALIIGIFFPSMNSIAYLALYGLRVMWLSMRTLRPMPQ